MKISVCIIVRISILPMMCYSSTIADWVRASALSHSEWMVLSSNPGEERNYLSKMHPIGVTVM